jgi:hypothetical protein
VKDFGPPKFHCSLLFHILDTSKEPLRDPLLSGNFSERLSDCQLVINLFHSLVASNDVIANNEPETRLWTTKGYGKIPVMPYNFRNIKPCSQLKVKGRFGGTRHLHLQG